MGLFRSSDRDRYHHNSGSFHLSGSLQRRFLEAHRQASLAAREVIHVSCYLHQNPTGRTYDDGEAAVDDDREAMQWFRIVAEQGDARAQVNLGAMYDNGLGVIEDDVLAYMWFNIASANGRVSIAGVGPEESRANLEREMTSAQIRRATELARACMASDYENCGP